MAMLEDSGSVTVTVIGYGKTEGMPGVVTKVTRARISVMTETGEMVFERRAAQGRRAGSGWGESRHYHISAEDLLRIEEATI